ncbi:hypothetical protein JCM8547_008129 [Rhodosporidiobolus lusitaniae]
MNVASTSTGFIADDGDSLPSVPSRKSKHHCSITVKGQPCKTCVSRSIPCTFDEPPTARVRKPKVVDGAGGADQGMQDAALGMTLLSSAAGDGRLARSETVSRAGSERPATAPLFPVDIAPPSSSALSSIASLLRSVQHPHSKRGAENDAKPQPPPTSLLPTPQLHFIAPHAFHALSLSSDPAPSSSSTAFQASRNPSVPAFFIHTPQLVYGRALHSSEEVYRAAVGGLEDGTRKKLGKLFVTQTQPAFPIFSPSQLSPLTPSSSSSSSSPSRPSSSSPDSLSHASLLSILAHSTTYLPPSRLSHKHLWRHALQLLEDEYRTPSLQTVQVALVTLTARPALNVGANTVAMARMVGATQLLGLHLDPANWRIPEEEKKRRKLVWWLVVVQDKWRALLYGRPSLISFDECNVPLPTVADFETSEVALIEEERTSAESFVAMCKLTMTVDTLLTTFFNLRSLLHAPSPSSALSTLSSILVSLSQLHSSLPPLLRDLPTPLPSSDVSHTPPPTGVRSFQLHLFGVQLVVTKLVWEKGVENEHEERRKEQVKKEGEEEVLALGKEVVEFVENLADGDMEVFWSPYSPFILTLLTSLLLRLSLSPPSLPSPISPPSSLLLTRLILVLLTAHHSHQWDVASLTLDVLAGQLKSLGEGEEVIEKLERVGLGRVRGLFVGVGGEGGRAHTASSSIALFPSATSDISVPLPSFPLPSTSASHNDAFLVPSPNPSDPDALWWMTSDLLEVPEDWKEWNVGGEMDWTLGGTEGVGGGD